MTKAVIDDATSIAEALDALATVAPDDVPVVANDQVLSYRALRDGAAAVASGLQRLGVGAGTRVVIALPNGSEFLFAFLGVLEAGGVAVPLFPRSSVGRLRRIARSTDSPVVIAEASAAQSGSPPRFTTVSDLWRETAARRVTRGAEDPCYIQFTSGSTGAPRGAELSHGCLLTNIRQMLEAMDITERDVFVSWLPTYHDMGLTLMLLTPLMIGARSVLLPTALRDVTPWLHAVRSHRGTFTAGPDFAYRLALRQVRDPSSFDLSSLRVAMNAAEPVRASTIRGWHTLFGLDHVMMTGYGLAEATLSVTCTQRGAAIEIDDRGLACLGAPLPGVEVAIVDGERRLSPGDEGEIVVRSPSRFLGYADDPRATDAVLWQGTHVRTGDLGRLDDRGRLYFVARDKDVIKIAGRTIAPQEVEELVDADPRVRLCAALGIDRGGIEGEQLVVCAELRESRTAAPDDAHAVLVGIAHQLHQAIGVRPQRTLLLEPGAIPLTQNGKLQRSVLRAAVTDGTIKDRLIDPRMPPKRAP